MKWHGESQVDPMVVAGAAIVIVGEVVLVGLSFVKVNIEKHFVKKRTNSQSFHHLLHATTVRTLLMGTLMFG